MKDGLFSAPRLPEKSSFPMNNKDGAWEIIASSSEHDTLPCVEHIQNWLNSEVSSIVPAKNVSDADLSAERVTEPESSTHLRKASHTVKARLSTAQEDEIAVTGSTVDSHAGSQV
jgi:hypothetical protein